MVFQKEKQDVSANELLQAIADGLDIHLNQCLVTGLLDINRLFDSSESFNGEKLALTETESQRTLTLSQQIVFDKCTFEENVVFAGPWSEPESVVVQFKADVIFNSSTFKGQARFRNAVMLRRAACRLSAATMSRTV